MQPSFILDVPRRGGPKGVKVSESEMNWFNCTVTQIHSNFQVSLPHQKCFQNPQRVFHKSAIHDLGMPGSLLNYESGMLIWGSDTAHLGHHKPSSSYD